MKPDLNKIKGLWDIAEQVYPVTRKCIRLADLFRRHNFTDPFTPPAKVSVTERRSLRQLLRRWNPSKGAIAVRFLSQNTFLMRVIGKVKVPVPAPVGIIMKDVDFP